MQTTSDTKIGIEYIVKKDDGSYSFRFQCEPVSWRDEPIDTETAAMIIECALSDGLVRKIDDREAGVKMYAGRRCAFTAMTKYIFKQNDLGAMLPDQEAVDSFARWNSSSYDNSRRRSIITGRYK